MSHIDDCPKGRSQFLTRGSLFQSHVAKVYVFDCIRHGTALEILSRASAACRFESPHTAVSECQWGEYFGLPVMSLTAAANYYGLNVAELEHHIRKKITYAGGLFESGMLVLRGTALESAREMGHTAGIQQPSSINLRKKENENVGRGGQLIVARPPRPRLLECRGAAGTRHRCFENRI
jgi:hypothetical protein